MLVLPSALVRMRLFDMPLAGLFIVPSVLIASRFIEPLLLLLFMSVVAGVLLVVAPEVDVLGVALIEPVDDGVLVVLGEVVLLGIAGIGCAGVAG